MDKNEWNRNSLQHRIEQWREQRAQKMAARLQLNSTKPRTISSNVLGYVNYRQPMKLQPGFRQQHGEGPRFNHVDHRWNPNHNYSGYREYHSPHNQYHHADHRNHGYSQGSYQHQQGQKKGRHFSSHKSLYNDRKSASKPSKRFSTSCGSINNTTEAGNQNVDCPPEQTALSSSLETNVNTLQVHSECSDNVTAVMEDVLNVEPEVEKTPNSDERTLKISVPEPDRLQDNTVIEAVETPKISELTENIMPAHQSDIDGCVSNIISDISVLEPATNSSEEVPTSFVDASSTIAVNKENSDDVPVVDAEAISESPVEVNDRKILEQVTEPDSNGSVQKEPSEDNDVKLVSESAVTVPENSTIAYECTDVDSGIVTNVEEISATEQMASLENNSDATNETLDLELNLSLKPEVEIIVEDTEEAVDPLKLNDEVASDAAANGQSNNEGIGGSYAGNCFNENADVFPVALLVAGDSDTEPYIIRYDDISTESDNDLSKEIERVENKLANISIVNKEEVASNEECFTPMKRERRQVLLDATNILPSSTIKFAVREIRKNDESQIIVTPVRRSARLSTMTPVSAHKNICVQKLDELSPEVIQKMKFVLNPAIDD